MENNIKINDKLHIAGVDYEVKHIATCKDCCLYNTRVCNMLDPSITCGEKTYLGFKTIGFNQENFNKILSKINDNRNKYKSNKNKFKQCKTI